MYGIFTYIWLIFMVNVGEYTIHGSYGEWGGKPPTSSTSYHLVRLDFLLFLPLKPSQPFPGKTEGARDVAGA